MSEWVSEDMARPLEPECKCGSDKPALYKCAWKLRKPFMIWAKDLKEGDQMQIPRKIGYSQVVTIRPGFTAGWLHVTLAVMATDEPFYCIKPGDPVMAMRPGHCEAPCCENCAREVGDNVHHCKAHWDAGERQGALDQREEVEA